jgi:hypothetical protein
VFQPWIFRAQEDTYSPIGFRPPWKTELLLCSEQGAKGNNRIQEGGGYRIVKVKGKVVPVLN